MTDHEQPISLELRDNVALVTLSRPEAYNALNRALSRALVATFEALRDNDDVLSLIHI